MSRTSINFWLDTVLMMTFVFVLWVATIVQYIFPPGTAASDWRLWGWTYDQWSQLQFFALCFLAICVLIHVMLHWTWVCGVIMKRRAKKVSGEKRQLSDGERTLYGVGLLVVILNVMGVGIAAASLMIQGPGQ